LPNRPRSGSRLVTSSSTILSCHLTAPFPDQFFGEACARSKVLKHPLSFLYLLAKTDEPEAPVPLDREDHSVTFPNSETVADLRGQDQAAAAVDAQFKPLRGAGASVGHMATVALGVSARPAPW
jgi:hypothetical protein